MIFEKEKCVSVTSLSGYERARPSRGASRREPTRRANAFGAATYLPLVGVLAEEDFQEALRAFVLRRALARDPGEAVRHRSGDDLRGETAR